MRKSGAAAVTARKSSLPADRRDNAPVELVCLALALAVLFLGLRIATIW